MKRSEVIRLVAQREIRERVRGRLTRAMTVITALLVVAAVVIPGAVKGASSTTAIGLVGRPAQALAPGLDRLARLQNLNLSASEIADDSKARALLRSGKLDVALTVLPGAARIEVEQSLSPVIGTLIRTVLDARHAAAVLSGAGLPAATLVQASTPVPVSTVALKPSPPDRGARAVAALAAAILMYVALSVFGAAVAGGVAQEKTSRTAEVLLGTVDPSELLTGKVIGIGLTGVGQLSVAAGAGLVANAAVHSAKVPSSVWALIPAFLVLFLAGFALYAFAFAAAGALVARQEELQPVTLPIGLPLLIGYLLVYAGLTSPNATWLRVASLLPPLTASLMPARIALGHVAAWEFPLAAVLMLASIYLMVRAAARVYSQSLIRAGGRVPWRHALRFARGGAADG